MSGRIRVVILVVALVAAGLVAWRLLDGGDREDLLSGYIEADNLYLSSPVAGTVASVSVVEGQRIGAGAQLFRIDPATLTAQGEQAEAQINTARTQISSAEASAAQADAEVRAAQADADKAGSDLSRLLRVRGDDPAAVAGRDIDTARAALKEARARVAAAQKTAASRRAQVGSARAQAEEARGGAREVAIRVTQLSPAAPGSGRVDKVFFQPGEWVSANQPVVSLIPDAKVKVRFFVPEQEVARYRPGQQVRFACDGCPGGLSARISYVSPRPEYTPPIIFSRETRDKLVFMVEAAPAQAARLAPGLPVDVTPLP